MPVSAVRFCPWPPGSLTAVTEAAIRETRVLGQTVSISGDPKDTYFTSLPDEIDDDVLSLLGKIVPTDIVAVDVGANIGLHALAMSHLAPDGRIHTFEASPDTSRHLQENVRANGASNVVVHAKAVSSEPGELTLFSNDEFAAGSTVIDQATDLAREYMSEEGRNIVRVPAVTLDAFVAEQGLERLDLIKIDVEGYDIDVIRGAKNTIATLRPTVITEFATFAITTHRQLLPADVLAEIRGTFDRVYVIDRWGHLRELANDHDAWGLLWQNANVQPVQDLLCVFEDSRLYDAVRTRADERPSGTSDTAEPEGSIEKLRADLEHARGEITALRELVTELEAERDAMERTVSWRVTRPLRAVRRHVPPKED
jgi:FkbM family methyltransferase